jgi:hypothetical protein
MTFLLLLLLVAAVQCSENTASRVINDTAPRYIDGSFHEAIKKAETVALEKVEAEVQRFLAWAANTIAEENVGFHSPFGPSFEFPVIPPAVLRLLQNELCTIGYAIRDVEYTDRIMIQKLKEQDHELAKVCAQKKAKDPNNMSYEELLNM